MKNIFIILIFLFKLSNFFAQDYGEIKTIKIHSKELNQDREIFIYTPNFYKEYKYRYYNVIYVFDSQTKEYFDLVHSLLPFLSKEVDNPYIVVGITSAWIDDPDSPYGRNDDLLPKPKNVPQNNFYGHANRENFIKFFEKEIIPYVDKNYRTKSKRILVGHSLSASFVISTFILNPHLYNSYISISPNLVYDKEGVSNELEEKEIEYLKFSSYVNEDNGWISSKSARKRLNYLLKEKFPDKVNIVTDSIPNKNHFTTFVPGIINGLTSYFDFIEKQPRETYQTTIEVKVPNEKDEVYISGNQDALGNWKEGIVKMNRISKFKRTITLYLKQESSFKFTRGSSDKEAIMKDYDLQYLGYIPISTSEQNNFSFEITNWTDKMKKN